MSCHVLSIAVRRIACASIRGSAAAPIGNGFAKPVRCCRRQDSNKSAAASAFRWALHSGMALPNQCGSSGVPVARHHGRQRGSTAAVSEHGGMIWRDRKWSSGSELKFQICISDVSKGRKYYKQCLVAIPFWLKLTRLRTWKSLLTLPLDTQHENLFGARQHLNESKQDKRA